MALKQLNGEIPVMRFDYTDIEKAFPKLNDRMIDSLLTYTTKAWDTQLAGCEICPTACITNRHEYCTMFDDEIYK